MVFDWYHKFKTWKGQFNKHSNNIIIKSAQWKIFIIISGKHIIVPGSHVEFSISTNNSNFVKNHPRNIPSNLVSMGQEVLEKKIKMWNVYRQWQRQQMQSYDNRSHDLRFMWAKQISEIQQYQQTTTKKQKKSTIQIQSNLA